MPRAKTQVRSSINSLSFAMRLPISHSEMVGQRRVFMMALAISETKFSPGMLLSTTPRARIEREGNAYEDDYNDSYATTNDVPD